MVPHRIPLNCLLCIWGELLSSPPLCPLLQSCPPAMQELTFFSATGVRVVGGGALLITMRCNQQPAWTDTPFFLPCHPLSGSVCFNCKAQWTTKHKPHIFILFSNSLLQTEAVHLFLVVLIISSLFFFLIYSLSLFISYAFVFPLSISPTIHPYWLHSEAKPDREARPCLN